MAGSVLIVDDHPGFRAVARMLLVTEGYTVVGEAADAAGALREAATLMPDVILLDVNLPDGDGFDVSRRLAAQGSLAAVVLVSSRERSDYGSLVDESGARGFISKAELTGAALRAVVAA